MPNTSTGAENSSAPKFITADSELIQIIFARLGELSDALDAAERRIATLEDGQSPCKITLPPAVVRHNPAPGELRPLTPREMRQQRLQARLELQNKQPQIAAKKQIIAAWNGRSTTTGTPTSTRKRK